MFYPWFEGCILPVNRTHTQADIPEAEKPWYCNHKGNNTQDVVAGCDFEGNFTFILARFEGRAHDSHVLRVVDWEEHFGRLGGALCGPPTPLLHKGNLWPMAFGRDLCGESEYMNSVLREAGQLQNVHTTGKLYRKVSEDKRIFISLVT